MNKTQIIDVTRSAVITDPEAFYENLMAIGKEDLPERTIPIVAYEGYNFLPTLYGYRSYFDTTATLDIAALGSRCDSVVLYQFANYSNVLVALCEDGIWTNSGGSTSEAWVHKVTLSTPAPGSYLAWTYCVIENVLYMYRQGNASVYKLTPTAFGPVTIASFVPSFLNMTGQMGIFRANGRLGFWDSANSISWSSLFDFTDFTPAIITLAANAIFNDVLGRIVHVQAFGSGFIIYSTKNIVGAQFNTTGSILFSAKSITEQAGIWTSKQVCQGATDMEHFAYTNTGIKRVKSDYTVEDIFVGIYDFLRESRDPVYLSFLQGRYLFLSLIDPAYVSGRVSFEVVSLTEVTVRLLYNGGELTDPENIPDTIDGIPLEQDILNKVMEGATDGLYTQWRASGSKIVPGRVSSMSPYQLDDPFTPDDDFPYEGNLDPLISMEDLIIARDTQVLANPVSINNITPSLMELGWHGSGTDPALERFKTRQLEEWTEYKTLITNLTSVITSVPHELTKVLLPSEYTSQALALAGAPANVPTQYTDLIDLPREGAITESFVASTWEYKKAYNTALRIRQLESKTYTQVPLYYGISATYWWGGDSRVSPSPNDLSVMIVGSPLRASSLPGDVHPKLSSVSLDSALGKYSMQGVSSGDGLSLAQWEAFRDYCIANLITEPPATLVYTTPLSGTYVYVRTTTNDLVNSYYNGFKQHSYQVVHYYVQQYDDPAFAESHIIQDFYVRNDAGELWGNSEATDRDLGYSLPSISVVESKTYGTQETLDWGQWLEDNPNPDFPYDTNELMIGAPAYSLMEGTTLPEHLDVTFPGATFLLQDATTAPIFPNYTGALVFDTGLQKWGKCKAGYRTLVDYSPINSNHDQIISYTNFGLDSGTLKNDGSIRLFSSKCTDSFIRYGKLAFSRQGYTYPEEIHIHFRRPFTGIIGIDASLDGRSIHSEFHEEETFVGVGLARIYPTRAGKWYTMSIGGEFDLRSIEFTGRVSGIR